MSLKMEQKEWLTKLKGLIKECPVESQGDADELNIDILQLKFAKQHIEESLQDVRRSLSTKNSKAFIKRHGITPDMVHDFSQDKRIYAMHDYEKIHSYLRKNSSKPWFCFDGYLFETAAIQSGTSIFEHGFEARYDDLGK